MQCNPGEGESPNALMFEFEEAPLTPALSP